MVHPTIHFHNWEMLPIRQKTAQLWPQATWQEQWFLCWNSCLVVLPGLHGSSVEKCKTGMLWDESLFSSQVTCLMGRGLALDCIYQWPGSLKERTGVFYWVAFTNRWVYWWPSLHLCQACVGALCVTLGKTRNRDEEVRSKTGFACVTGI